MTLPTSGPISLGDVQSNFGGSSSNIKISNYYRGGGIVPNTSANFPIPTSNTISLSSFYLYQLSDSINDIGYLSAYSTYIGVGQRGSNGFIVASTDGGITWQEVYVSSAALNSIAIDNTNNTVIVVGGEIVRSTDGLSWTSTLTLPSGYVLSQVIRGGGYFVAVGGNNSTNSPSIYYSNVGTSWSTGSIGGTQGALTYITYISSSMRYIASGGQHPVGVTSTINVCYADSTPSSWTVAGLNGSDCGQVLSLSGYYSMAVTGTPIGSGYGYVYGPSPTFGTFADTSTPYRLQLSTVAPVETGINQMIHFTSTAYSYSPDGTTWTKKTLPISIGNVLAYDTAGTWFCVTSGGTVYTHNTTSSLSSGWTNTGSTIDSGVRVLRYANGVWLFCGGTYGSIYRSTNTTTWTQVF